MGWKKVIYVQQQLHECAPPDAHRKTYYDLFGLSNEDKQKNLRDGNLIYDGEMVADVQAGSLWDCDDCGRTWIVKERGYIAWNYAGLPCPDGVTGPTWTLAPGQE